MEKGQPGINVAKEGGEERKSNMIEEETNKVET